MLKNLKRLREEAAISQKALADIVGVSQQSINKYENHNIEPDIETMIRIAEYFQTSVDFLVGHSEVRRKIEAVQAFELTTEESCLVEKYRKLNKRQRDCVNNVVDTCIEA